MIFFPEENFLIISYKVDEVVVVLPSSITSTSLISLINIESIYKWKKNGIPHRYKTLINDLQKQQSKESKISSDESKIIKTEIIAGGASLAPNL